MWPDISAAPGSSWGADIRRWVAEPTQDERDAISAEISKRYPQRTLPGPAWFVDVERLAEDVLTNVEMPK